MRDRLLSLAERVRVEATNGLDPAAQSARGQYFTPDKTAALIAGLPSLPHADVLRILDPGAGSGMLSAAIVERVCADGRAAAIDLTVVEADASLLPALHQTARLCRQWGCDHGVAVGVRVVAGDFVLMQTGLDAELGFNYDLVIMNPPYQKLGSASWQRKVLESSGWRVTNLYAAFLAVGVDSLRHGGQLVAITPRSFANGPYFGQFRRRLLAEVAFNRLHTFESRSTVFADTGVLQENVVFSATKGGHRDSVVITSSHGPTDEVAARSVGYGELVSPTDRQQFIRISVDETSEEAVRVLEALPASLAALGLKVSTGKVVDFRARQNLRDTPRPGCLPLVYPGNLRQGEVQWPRPIGKAQAFGLLKESDSKALLPSGYYVLVKRFSAKEERRRIVAAVWDPTRHEDQPVAFENHLNVFHKKGVGLDRELAWGLCLWLNSTVVDRYFRTFSGHTQVNATDLRSLNYPDAPTLRRLGQGADRLPEQDALDQLVEEMTREPVAA
ncbi:MAG: Eco57I restriction-modification methylase domain-containing protein [Bifidobacteriaceae bacterium]|nr:Eco57I restriction-modification methylase domain-containing protein [Bifidobacteriaceae bacterium]